MTIDEYNGSENNPIDINKDQTSGKELVDNSSTKKAETRDTLAEPPPGPQAQGPSPATAVGTADTGSGDGPRGARGTAAMDVGTRREVARKGGMAVSRNREHMAEIGRKGGQSVSKNREHMARIGRKGGAASRGQS